MTQHRYPEFYQEWQDRVRAESGESCLQEALALIARPDFAVEVLETDEAWGKGDTHWAVQVCGTDFWMDAFKTPAQAFMFIASMGWPRRDRT